MFSSLADVWKMPDLRSRIFFTLALLAVYRLGIFIPAPGVDRAALSEFFQSGSNTLFGLYDMFSGGALEQFSVFVLGIMPYISASIIIQVLSSTVPQLERLSKEGQTGRNKLNQYTRYLTIVIALVQSGSIAVGLEQMKVGNGESVVIAVGWGFRLMTMITMTAGSCFVMWLGEQITERGIGSGSSLIITAGIVAGLPTGAYQLAQKVGNGDMNLLGVTLLVLFMFAVLVGIVFIERGQRRVPIQYAKRVVGRRVYGGQETHLPLKVNVAGVIPPIFASAVLMFPATLSTLLNSDNVILGRVVGAFTPGAWLYNTVYVGLIIFFAYFYTAVTFNPVDVADNLKKQGGFIPGVRPGRQTAEYIDRILSRLTLGGALYLAAVCVIPTLLITQYGIPFYFGGTGLLIVVSVSLDTVAQIEGHMLTKHYDGLIQSSNVRGRQRRLLERSKSE
ncbi:MAG: preprotein translocase subunit SecY [Deltaproteobacteria bacterium]|nr:preprotein translocase subunit SecY [Deltaproteobacteria bacterium]MBK9368187.1 preprotein translocase subunit SecY [Deltaproteobacteria bacterium]MBK9645184.1 preprotein translocase subunit SecY [Deltaproteobacteria bacterium]